MAESQGSPDMNGAGTRTEHKTRRPHRKSRYGCTKCKERRVKCDELTPRCSRCQKTNLVCHYPKRQPNLLGSDDYWMEPIDPLLLALEMSNSGRNDGGGSSPESSGHSSCMARSPLASSLLNLSTHGKRLDSPLRSQVAQTLAPAEFELLKHYLEHTSKDLTVDTEDQYTLQVGIPNLACQSKFLMRSVLALAAICKSCDIINQPSVSLEDRSQVIEYLALADQYHMQSLREIQTTIPDAKHYDHVLANAAIMGMYGSGSHSTRIWLTKTATFGEQTLYDYMPKNSQWISLWRAVDLAYMGILNDTSRADDIGQHQPHQQRSSPAHSPPEYMASSSSFQPQYEYKVTSRVERPRTPTVNHPLFPIMAATAGSALSKLRETAREVTMIHSSRNDLVMANLYDPGTPTAAYNTDPALQSCFSALSIFTNIIAEAFPNNNATPIPASQLTFEVDIDPSGRLSEISPWLRRYAASVTSMIPSKLPRRMIASFVHKVPTTFLTLVSEMITLIHTGTPPPPPTNDHTNELDLDLVMSMNLSSWDVPTPPQPHHHSSSSSHSGTNPPDFTNPSLPHQLALEIFTYWLVLMILLDNVWWIGDIGAWELGRIVNFRKTIQQQQRQQQQQQQQHAAGISVGYVGSMMCIWSKEEDWWPESMYEVSRQFDKHKPKGGST